MYIVKAAGPPRRDFVLFDKDIDMSALWSASFYYILAENVIVPNFNSNDVSVVPKGPCEEHEFWVPPTLAVWRKFRAPPGGGMGDGALGDEGPVDEEEGDGDESDPGISDDDPGEDDDGHSTDVSTISELHKAGHTLPLLIGLGISMRELLA